MNSLDEAKLQYGDRIVRSLISDFRTLLETHPSIITAPPLAYIDESDTDTFHSAFTTLSTTVASAPVVEMYTQLNDYDLVKFLIARNMDPTRACEMLIATNVWREENKIDCIAFPAPPNHFRGVVGVEDYDIDLESPLHPPSWRLFVTNLGGKHSN